MNCIKTTKIKIPANYIKVGIHGLLDLLDPEETMKVTYHSDEGNDGYFEIVFDKIQTFDDFSFNLHDLRMMQFHVNGKWRPY